MRGGSHALDLWKDMSVTLKTSNGDLKISLHTDLAPRNTENFLCLCASGAYTNTLFHRNIAAFMIQGGDTSGTGKGGESIWGVPVPRETTPLLSHNRRGVLSMVNGTDGIGSQFFIMYGPAPHLDGECTVIGQIIGGEDTLSSMEAAPVTGKRCTPVEPITILSAHIHSNPFAN